jgi:hypothetical protein
MPKGLRRRLFYVLIVLFFLLGSMAVMYAQGWRLALEPFGFAKVGAIYIRTFPPETELVLAGEPRERKSGLFYRGTFLNNLLPGTYELEIESPGFHSWKAQVSVSSSLVTTLRYIVLVPSLAAAATSTSVQDMNVAGSNVILETENGLTTLSGTPVAGSDFMSGSEDGTVLLTYSAATNEYLAVDLTATTATTTALGRLQGQTMSFEPVPGNNSLFLTRTSGGLGLLGVPDGNAVRLATSGVSAAAAIQNRVFWTTFDAETGISLISFYDIPSGTPSADVDSLPGRVTAIIPRDNDNLLTLSEDGSIFSLGLGQSSRGRLTRDARDMFLSNDGGALAVLGADGIRVFFLRDERRNALFAIPEPNNIERLAWYRDNEHLFVIYPDRVAFLDLADTTLANFTTAAISGRAEYLSNENILYFLEDDVLYRSVFHSD